MLEETGIDDDESGASSGNGNGLVDYAETIELTFSLRNAGLQDAADVSGELTSVSPYVEVLVGGLEFGHIPAGGEAANIAPAVIAIAPEVPNGERLDFLLTLSEDPGARHPKLTALAPAYLAGVTAVDDSDGNGNGIPDSGETVTLTLLIENIGDSDTPDLQAQLGSYSPYFLPEQTPHTVGIIPAGEEVAAGGFVVTLAPTCPPFHADYLSLELSGPGDYAPAHPLVFCAGQPFADDLEREAIAWQHYPATAEWMDQWHRESHRNHTAGGEISWKCGGPGDAAYGSEICAVLETVDFLVPPGGRLQFWHWIDAEDCDSLPGWATDGGLLEISMDSGESWTQIEPEDGYPYQIRPSSFHGPFPIFTPVWSGTHDWTETGVDLSAYEGLARVRWVFGADAIISFEGWYIDGVRVGVGWPSDAAGEGQALSLHPQLLPIAPNPVRLAAPQAGGVRIRWAQTRPGAARLALFDSAGRLVRRLSAGACGVGEHHLLWDGREESGLPVPAGVYFVRLATSEGEEVRPLTVVR